MWIFFFPFFFVYLASPAVSGSLGSRPEANGDVTRGDHVNVKFIAKALTKFKKIRQEFGQGRSADRGVPGRKTFRHLR